MSKTTQSATIALFCLALVACDGVELKTQNADSESGSDNTNVNTDANALLNIGAEVPEDERFGDDYWVLLAQTYPAFVPPPEIGAAHDASENINLGRWGDVIEWPQIASGAANLPDGRVVTWSSTQDDDFGGQTAFTHGSIFDPVTETFTDRPNNNHNTFCAGISMLADGSIFTAGGGDRGNVATTSIFNNDSWSLTNPMNQERWYPQSTTLPSGQVVTSLGTKDTAFSEIWTQGQGWSTLANANLQSILDDNSVKNNLRDWFPALNVAPDGRLFHPGPSSELFSLDLYTDGAAYTAHGKREADDPHRLYNTTVMYDIGKMLIAGGGQPALNSALTIDINGSTPIVTATEPMAFARSMQDSVVLPDGQVLVIGGNSSGIQFSDEGTQITPEIWNPDTGQWTSLAPHSKPRNYHTTSVLLKDGRVAAMGGGLCGNCATNQKNGEIFEPPYLFNPDGTRAVQPQITGGTAEAIAGDTLSLTATSGMQSFAMLRLVAITHHHSTDQRYVPLTFTETQAGSYSIQLPANRNVLVPGYYWVFALDANGVPSVGHTVLVNPTTELVPEPPSTVTYEYYEGEWDELPDFDSLTPVLTGQSESFSLAAKQQDDFFGFRFTATLSLSQAGTYTFYTTSDDGSQLFINGQMVVDNDGLHGSKEEQGNINLSAGTHDLVLTYFEKTGGSNLSAQIEGPSISKQALQSLLVPLDGATTAPLNPVDPTPANPTPANSNGGTISYEYYEGSWNAIPDFDALAPVATGELNEFTTSPKQQDEFFGFRYTTTLYVPTAQQYTFYVNSDDGSKLYVNNQLVVDNDGLHRALEEQGTIALTAGEHDIVVEYFNRTGGDTLGVQLASTGLARQTLVPSIAPLTAPIEPVTPVAPGDNLLSNGNFQTNLNQWSVCGGEANVTAGTAVLSAGGCLFQEFEIVPQARYTLQCDANAVADFASMQLSMSDESFTALATDVAPVISAATAPLIATVTAPNGTAQGVVTLFAQTEANFDNCVVLVDESTVVAPNPPAAVTTTPANDLLLNASFENGLNSWFGCGGEQAITSDGVNGGNAVNLTNAGCLFQEFAITPGESYELNCTGLSARDFTSVTLTFNDNLFEAVDAQSIPVTASQYANTNIALTAPANATSGVVTLYADTDASFDSCGVVAAGSVTATQPVAPPAAAIPVNAADNLLANGDFTNGAANWLTCGGDFNIEAQGANNSDAAVLGTTACVFQEFEAVAGQAYELSCSGRATGFASITLSYSDVSFSALATEESTVPGSTFSNVTATETAPANTAQGAVTLYADESATFDNCVVVER